MNCEQETQHYELSIRLKHCVRLNTLGRPQAAIYAIVRSIIILDWKEEKRDRESKQEQKNTNNQHLREFICKRKNHNHSTFSKQTSVLVGNVLWRAGSAKGMKSSLFKLFLIFSEI